MRRCFVLSTALLLGGEAVAQYPQDNLVFQFALDEISSGVVVDSSGNDYIGTLHGDVSLVDDALYFGAEGGYVNIDLDGFNPNAFSLSYRIKPETFNNYNQQVGPGWGQFLQHSQSNQGMYLGQSTSDRWRPGELPKYVADEWQTFTTVYDGSDMRFYVNGELQITGAREQGSDWNSFLIGNPDPIKTVRGSVADLVLYSMPLDDEQVMKLHLGESLYQPRPEQLSSLWGVQGELWSPTSRLPFVALAGYAEGKEPIPDNLPIIANIKELGAVGSYNLEVMSQEELDAIANADTAALLAALELAAEHVTADNMMRILIPAGDYLINEPIHITVPGLVIAGDDRTATSIRFWGPSLVERGGDIRDKWIRMGNPVSWSRTASNRAVLDLDNLPERGDFQLRVREPLTDEFMEKLAQQNYRVRLVQNIQYGENSVTPRLATYAYQTPWFAIKNSSGGTEVAQQLVVDVQEDRQTLILDRPLRFTPTDESTYNRNVALNLRLNIETDTVNQGLENLTLIWPDTDWTNHGGNHGQGAIQVSGENSWVRNLHLINADNGVELDRVSANITVSDIIVDANRVCRMSGPIGGRHCTHGHHGSTIRGTDNLFERIEVRATQHHDLTIVNCQGCVISDTKGKEFDMDHHRQFTYASVWTQIDVGSPVKMWYSTGRDIEGARAAAYMTYWNIRADEDPRWPIQWPEDEGEGKREGWGLHHLNMIGTQIEGIPAVGDGVRPFPFTGEDAHFEPILPWDIYPVNIYHAMKEAYQKGKLAGMANPSLEYVR